MKTPTKIAGVVLLLALGCTPRPDPRVEAARDFQQTAFDLIERDTRQAKKLNSLHVGMTDEEVLRTAGPPTRRQSLGSAEEPREIWTYAGELKQLGTLTFEDRKLVQIQVN